MKNILFGLLIGFLAIGFVLPVYAQQQAQQGTAQTNTQQVQTQAETQNQAQTQNQGEEQQLQNQEQVQTNAQPQIQAQTKAQIKEQAKTVNGEAYRNKVSEFVQSLLDVAEEEDKGNAKGIGEQVRTIAQEQAKVQEKVADQIEAVQKRNSFKTFLIGTDYKNIGALRSEMVQLRNRIQQLNQVMEQVKNEGEIAQLQSQVQTMEQEMTNIESFIKVNEGKFSLFGWLVKLFN